jgi:hypothetical protein
MQLVESCIAISAISSESPRALRTLLLTASLRAATQPASDASRPRRDAPGRISVVLCRRVGAMLRSGAHFVT